jgi:hypothetical protein
MTKSQLRVVAPTEKKRTVPPKRGKNAELRTREHFTPDEVEALIEAARGNRYGHRDGTMILLTYRRARILPSNSGSLLLVCVPKGCHMGLWLLSFTQREVAVIVEAETLVHARLIAAANQICRASLFDEGLPLSPVFMRKSRQISLGERSRKMRPLICSAC